MSGSCGPASSDGQTQLTPPPKQPATGSPTGLTLRPAKSKGQAFSKENRVSSVLEVGNNSFQKEVLQSDAPVVVDFYATWCGPCRRLSPILADLNSEFEGRIKFVKIDTDQEQELANQYSITALPTLLFFDGGQIAGQFSGLPEKSSLKVS